MTCANVIATKQTTPAHAYLHDCTDSNLIDVHVCYNVSFVMNKFLII